MMKHSATAVLVALVLWVQSAPAAQAEITVSNVSAIQLSDGTKRVQVLYDMNGAPASGATVSIEFSSDAGATWDIIPSSTALTGAVGYPIADGTSHEIIWDPAFTLPAGTYGTEYQARVTASEWEEVTVTLPGPMDLVMVRIPAGTFQMGWDGWGYPTEPVHTVTLTNDFLIAKYETTQGQWDAIMGTNSPDGENVAVAEVSWDSIAGPGGFIEVLTTHLAQTGQSGVGVFRLPSEAEWEYAAKGGSNTAFSFGTPFTCDPNHCSCEEAEPWAAFCVSGPVEVGQKLPNPFGLFDMEGAVAEWVSDWDAPYSAAAQTDPQGPPTGTNKVLRSNYRALSGNSDLNESMPSRRYSYPPDLPGISAHYERIIGFRLAATP